MKTKLGVSAGVLGALTYFMGMFGGYVALILICGYIYLFEDNENLKKNAFRAFAICLGFSLLNVVIGLLPDLLLWIGNLVSIFNGYFYPEVIFKLEKFMTSGFNIIETLVLAAMGVITLIKKDTKDSAEAK